MSSHSTIIILIVSCVIAVGAGLLLFEYQRQLAQEPSQIMKDQIAVQQSDDNLRIVNVVGTNVDNGNLSYLRIELRYEGKGRLNLSNTNIQMRTDQTIADLRYRNGTTSRNVVNGFYTD